MSTTPLLFIDCRIADTQPGLLDADLGRTFDVRLITGGLDLKQIPDGPAVVIVSEQIPSGFLNLMLARRQRRLAVQLAPQAPLNVEQRARLQLFAAGHGGS